MKLLNFNISVNKNGSFTDSLRDIGRGTFGLTKATGSLGLKAVGVTARGSSKVLYRSATALSSFARKLK